MAERSIVKVERTVAVARPFARWDQSGEVTPIFDVVCRLAMFW